MIPSRCETRLAKPGEKITRCDEILDRDLARVFLVDRGDLVAGQPQLHLQQLVHAASPRIAPG